MNPLGSAGLPSQLSFLTDLSSLAFAGSGSAAATPRAGKSAAIRLVKALRVNKSESMLSPFIQKSESEFSGQCKCKNVAPHGNGHILLPGYREAHRRSVKFLAGVEVPKRLARFGIHGL